MWLCLLLSHGSCRLPATAQPLCLLPLGQLPLLYILLHTAQSPLSESHQHCMSFCCRTAAVQHRSPLLRLGRSLPGTLFLPTTLPSVIAHLQHRTQLSTLLWELGWGGWNRTERPTCPAGTAATFSERMSSMWQGEDMYAAQQAHHSQQTACEGRTPQCKPSTSHDECQGKLRVKPHQTGSMQQQCDSDDGPGGAHD